MFAPVLPFPSQGCNAPHAPVPQFPPSAPTSSRNWEELPEGAGAGWH